MEIWKDIEGYEGLYQVSNEGRVKSFWSGKEKILKQHNCKGYLEVGLYKKEDKQKYKLIHRLVAETFIPNPNNLPQINHKDENKTNNSVDNLEWCSRSYNINYGSRNEKVGKKNSISLKGKKHSNEWKKHMSEIMTGKKLSENVKKLLSKLKSKPIVQLTLDGKFIKEWASSTEAAATLGFNHSNISACCNGERKTHKGFKWMHKSDYEKMLEEQLSL